MFRASGPSGLLRVGYQVAAEIGAWEIVVAPRLPQSFQFTGEVLRTHAYWITQRPVDLVLSLGTTEWCWHDVVVKYIRSDELCIALTHRPAVASCAVVMEGA